MTHAYTMIIDSHIHLTNYAYEGTFTFFNEESGSFVLSEGNREDILRLCREAGVGAFVEPAIEIESNYKILAAAKEYPDVIFPVIGVHPTRTYKYRTVDANGVHHDYYLRWTERHEVEMLARTPGVVAIGETGLDYHFERAEQHRTHQKAWFIWQISLADKLGLPLVLHIREADRDALRILRRYRNKLHGGVVHCFYGDAERAREYTDLGLMIGIGGALLSEPGEPNPLEDAVKAIPLESILIETDGPHVKPYITGVSGKKRKKARNTSLILPQLIMRIAELKNSTPGEVEQITTENAIRLFSLCVNENRPQ